MNDTNYEAPHCGAFSTPHSHPSWAQIFASGSCLNDDNNNNNNNNNKRMAQRSTEAQDLPTVQLYAERRKLSYSQIKGNVWSARHVPQLLLDI